MLSNDRSIVNSQAFLQFTGLVPPYLVRNNKLTYMSIYDAIGFRVQEERLFLLEPVLPGGAPIKRLMYISQEIKTLLDGPWVDEDWEKRGGSLRGDLELFIDGGEISVSEKPYGYNAAYLKQLDPAREEVWEIRSRNPRPAIRVFGRFARTNLFVAITWALRTDLGYGSTPDWKHAILKCKSEWTKLLTPYPPHSGANFHDYATNIVLV